MEGANLENGGWQGGCEDSIDSLGLPGPRPEGGGRGHLRVDQYLGSFKKMEYVEPGRQERVFAGSWLRLRRPASGFCELGPQWFSLFEEIA